MTDSLSSRVYHRLLALYPEDFRRDFGGEMVLAFEEELAAARREGRARGTVGVWSCVLWETLCIALPGRLGSPTLRAYGIALIFSIISLSAQAVFSNGLRPRMHIDAAALLPSIATALLPLVVICACRGSRVIALNLSVPPREEP